MKSPQGFSAVWLLVCAVVAIAIAGTWYVSSPRTEGPVACTMEAKLCPDGSYVGRSGPLCEFAACPTSSTTPPTGGGGGGILPYNSGITGSVMLAPTCPVMRDPPEPQCAAKPYATVVKIYHRNNLTQPFATVKSGEDGTFKISLPPGEYSVGAGESTTLPRCDIVPATVEPTGYTSVDVPCDTGIR